MRINATEKAGKEGVNNLIKITSDQVDPYWKAQEEMQREIFG